MNYLKISSFSLVLIILFGFACNNSPKSGNLTLVNKFKINVPEPSGLTFDASQNYLIMVSDNNSGIYKTDLEGNVVNFSELSEIDLEAITIINDSAYAIASEKTNEIVIVDTNFIAINTLKTGIMGKENSGFEGISYIPTENVLLVANEKSPTDIYKISLSGEILSTHKIPFAEDISGLFYDYVRSQIWILSEESATLFCCNMNFEIVITYDIPDEQIEGITINGNDLYLVSDKNETLFHYKIAE